MQIANLSLLLGWCVVFNAQRHWHKVIRLASFYWLPVWWNTTFSKRFLFVLVKSDQKLTQVVNLQPFICSKYWKMCNQSLLLRPMQAMSSKSGFLAPGLHLHPGVMCSPFTTFPAWLPFAWRLHDSLNNRCDSLNHGKKKVLNLGMTQQMLYWTTELLVSVVAISWRLYVLYSYPSGC